MLIEQSPWILLAAVPLIVLLFYMEVKARRERKGQARRNEQPGQHKEG